MKHEEVEKYIMDLVTPVLQDTDITLVDVDQGKILPGSIFSGY